MRLQLDARSRIQYLDLAIEDLGLEGAWIVASWPRAAKSKTIDGLVVNSDGSGTGR
jgi:hypothetical protein